MHVRRELAASWAPTGSFSFDGSSSDLALQLYTRFQAGDVVARLSLSSIPETVASRLSDVNVAFGDLDGFAQRAVLWDSGFAVTSDNEVKQMWTLGGASMAEIALTLDEYEATSCTAFDCTQPDGTTAYNNNQCTGTDMLTGVKCAVEEFDATDVSLAMWSIGGDSSTIPEIQVAKHSWTDSSSGTNYKVYAVHTLGVSSERNYGDCPSTETYGYLNIPCYGSDDVSSSEITEPTPSDWVTSWMATYATTTSSSSSSAGDSLSNSGHMSSTSTSGQSSHTMDTSSSSGASEHTGTNVALLGGAVGGGLGLLLLAVLVAFCVAGRRRKRADSNNEGTPKAVEHTELRSPDERNNWDDERRPTVSTHPRSTLDDSLPRSGVTLPSSDDSWSNPGTRPVPLPPRQANRPSPAPVPQPTRYEGDFRNSRHDIAGRPPRNQETSRLSAPVPVVQPIAYEENVRAFGSDAAQPPSAYEEALHRSRASNPPIAAAYEDSIHGLGATNALHVLAADPSVDRRRIQLDQLQVERQLPMTTLQTDSCVAHFNGQQVLVKRLAPSQSVNVAAVEDLAFEIQQRAHVGHKNLVQFVGAGWTSAIDLAMVTEFLPQGTLRAYLDRNKASMRSWTQQKTAIASGIARALAYLHRQTPTYIHHEICAKNVLLTENLEAKLASCGSPETNPSVGAKQKDRHAFWAAPEVLQGASYSPAADIYSYGVLLAELDTCETPYFDVRSPSGSNLEQAEILALVVEGRLRPNFSAECPRFIRQLGVACCQQDPDKRLTAQQIVQLLEGK
ncbi:hypothetical protein PF005_g17226 [Phytophthora fragariae]|uniref:Protein kinase domain-containing protein n=1 Tax=Phytophthora fragariae TaxID=53985 RepID=A0A6A3RKL4_9STRA|nr:hypothetical protein PF003_g7575 [Phytophthora fragariae]KAE8931491.1 hypothetical protein PF009_g18449 [Phytophthora fragariae]KAE8995829.1 hypothetical protein PF011_g16160 [Phytophthora fragariae]KAE9095723.1 hypothetical protein PF007_g17275 [Phytophthora fragariae]KAE9128553.1 hypothetical protein PF006_g16254 [Phytophthora fragariae]